MGPQALDDLKEIRPAFVDRIGPLDDRRLACGQGSNGHCHYNAVVVMAVQRRRGLVQGAALCVDATHPYAVEATKNIRAAANAAKKEI